MFWIPLQWAANKEAETRYNSVFSRQPNNFEVCFTWASPTNSFKLLQAVHCAELTVFYPADLKLEL